MSTEKIKFSVLMSVYKNDITKDVKLAIDSLLNQTLLPNQIVIMVDGPVGNDLENLLDEYGKNKLIEIHKRDTNLGLGITLNEGLNYCKYDFVARMDADDICHLDRFEKQIKFLEKNKDIDVIGCNVIEYDEKMENIISIRRVPEKNEEIKKFLKERNPLNHPTVIYKKGKVLEVGGYEDYPYFEDYYLWAKMIHNNSKIYNIQDLLYDFRSGTSMYRRRGGKKYLKCIKKFEKGLLDLGIINKNEYNKSILKRSIGALMPSHIRGYIYRKKLREKYEK